MKNVCSQTQENFEKLKKAKVILLDLDGTVYIDYEPIDGVIASLERLRASGRKLVYLTNNSSKSYKDYEKNLRLSGIFESGDEIYTSAMATAEYLNEEKPGARVYLLAPDDVKADFRAAGVNVVESSPDVAVLAYDITLDYKKIREFDYFLKSGVYYVATHPDFTCPAKGCSVPDAGSFIEMFRASSGRAPDLIVGKPRSAMGERIKKRYGVQSDEVLMVGDRLSTDIAFGNNCGFYTALVYTGEATRESYAASDVKATVDCENFAVLTEKILA